MFRNLHECTQNKIVCSIHESKIWIQCIFLNGRKNIFNFFNSIYRLVTFLTSNDGNDKFWSMMKEINLCNIFDYEEFRLSIRNLHSVTPG